jgi:hypothetical protein
MFAQGRLMRAFLVDALLAIEACNLLQVTCPAYQGHMLAPVKAAALLLSTHPST